MLAGAEASEAAAGADVLNYPNEIMQQMMAMLHQLNERMQPIEEQRRPGTESSAYDMTQGDWENLGFFQSRDGPEEGGLL